MGEQQNLSFSSGNWQFCSLTLFTIRLFTSIHALHLNLIAITVTHIMYLCVVFLFSHWKYKLLWTGIKSSGCVFMLSGTQEFQYHTSAEQMNTSLSENAFPNLSQLFIADLLHCAALLIIALLFFSPKFPAHPKGLMDPGC